MSKRTGCGSKIDEQGGLPDEVMLGIGMKVMVTFNVETDLRLDMQMEREGRLSR